MQNISFVSIRITSVSFIDLLELCSNSTVTLVLVRMPLLYNPQNHVDFLSVMLHLMKEKFEPKEMKKKKHYSRSYQKRKITNQCKPSVI